MEEDWDQLVPVKFLQPAESAAKEPVAKKQKKQAKRQQQQQQPVSFVELFKKQRNEKPIPKPARAPDNIPVETMAQYTKVAGENSSEARNVALHTMPVEKGHRANMTKIPQLPPKQVSILTQFPWFSHMARVMSENETLTVPNVEVYSRACIAEFLTVPDPDLLDVERPCRNLLQPPLPGQDGIMCASLLLSSKTAENFQGYQLREMLPWHLETQIKSLVKQGKRQQAKSLLPELRGVCFLCHIYMATMFATTKVHEDEIRDKKDISSAPLPSKNALRLANQIGVIVGPGQYKSEIMLCSDRPNMCVWEPIPLWNEGMFIASKRTRNGKSLDGFLESEGMLF